MRPANTYRASQNGDGPCNSSTVSVNLQRTPPYSSPHHVLVEPMELLSPSRLA